MDKITQKSRGYFHPNNVTIVEWTIEFSKPVQVRQR
jgi:hypothetical protein